MSQASYNPQFVNARDKVWKARQALTMATLEHILENNSPRFEVLFTYPTNSPTHYQLIDKRNAVGIILSRRGPNLCVIEATYNRHCLAYTEAMDELHQHAIKKGFYDHEPLISREK